MTTPNSDLVGSVTKAEAEAAALVAAAEGARQEAVHRAEAEAARLISDAKGRAQTESTERLARAEVDAAAILERAATEAETAAHKAGAVPDARMAEAVDVLVKALRDQWQ
jgi:vacuolar-type H+-ATPase subunit H